MLELGPDEDSGEKIPEAARHRFLGIGGEPPFPFVELFEDFSAVKEGRVSEFLVANDIEIFQLLHKIVELAWGRLLDGDEVGLLFAK